MVTTVLTSGGEMCASTKTGCVALHIYIHTYIYSTYIHILTSIWRQIFEEHNFRIFVDEVRTSKNWRYSQLNIIRGQGRHHTAGSMALLHYFSKASEVEKLPDPQGVLAKDITSSAISSANTEVQRVLQLKVDPLTLACYL